MFKNLFSTVNIKIVNLSTETTKCNLRHVLFMLLIRPKVFALY